MSISKCLATQQNAIFDFYNDKILEPILTVSSEMLIRMDALMLLSKAHNILMSSDALSTKVN